MDDITIAHNTPLQPIEDIANHLGLSKDQYELYGHGKAKITFPSTQQQDGKLILVTSINPTPYGEGKTTVVIGIHDAMRKLGYNSIAVLREPSLGPVFGIKGGATGGGFAQVIPSEDINLHFTGDFHAITSANNLLSAMIDNHIFQGNELRIDSNQILFRRCLDMNDRALRTVNLTSRLEKFDITATSEIMAIFCLARDIEDLKKRLGTILIAYDTVGQPIFAHQLGCVDAMAILLKDAIKPNLVQTLEHNPVLIHGGPFANIAHGCNSLIATKTALSLSDYVLTEAGFGSDLGAEKFLDIKCRHDLTPNCIVINATIRALKHNGHCPKEQINQPSLEYLKKGIGNLQAHIDNMRQYTSNLVVCLNQFHTDSIEEIKYIQDYIQQQNIPFAICDSYQRGSEGSLALAETIANVCQRPVDFRFLYSLEDSIDQKIETICKQIYRASTVEFTENAKKTMFQLTDLGYDNLPICIAKTQYSLSDDPKRLGVLKDYTITIDQLTVKSGALFIVVYLADVMTMPGLSKIPNTLKMKLGIDGTITGLF